MEKNTTATIPEINRCIIDTIKRFTAFCGRELFSSRAINKSVLRSVIR